MQHRENELRCFCRRTPLLALYGVRNGTPFVHVKVYKQDRIFGEVYFEGGKVKLRCRECRRWTTINIIGEPTLVETTEPDLSVTDMIAH